jgi:hypothetical protein
MRTTVVYKFTIYSYLAREKKSYIDTKQQTHQHIKSLHNGIVNANGKSIPYKSKKREYHTKVKEATKGLIM